MIPLKNNSRLIKKLPILCSFCLFSFLFMPNDCDEEDIEINGGVYIEPEIYYVFANLGLGVGYRYFFNSDYQRKISLKLSFVFYE